VLTKNQRTSKMYFKVLIPSTIGAGTTKTFPTVSEAREFLDSQNSDGEILEVDEVGNAVLTLRPYIQTGEGRLGLNRETVAYEVHHLPTGEEAWIANMGIFWQLLRRTNGIQGEWAGDYRSPDEALTALRQMVRRAA